MSITTYKNSFLSHNTLLTYDEKLKNELDNIPKLHKKFFMNSLAKHKFDSDVYIPMENERNRKVYPNKDYLINKIISLDNLVNSNKKIIDNTSKNFSNFFKAYNYLKSTNTKQKDYMHDTISIYKDKFSNKNNYNDEDLEYKHDENIFDNSVLLDCSNSQNFKKFENFDNQKMLMDDKNILLSFDKAINKTRSPNSMANKSQNYKDNFITSINQSYFINKKSKEKNDNIKKEMKIIKTEINLDSNKIKGNINLSQERKIDSKNTSKIKIEGVKNKSKNNTLDKYILNSKLLKINKISRNINKEFKETTNTINATNTSIIKESLEIQKTQKQSNLKNSFLNKFNKDDNKNNNNIKTYKAINNKDKSNKTKKTKFNISESNNNNNSKYLLTTLNKINNKSKIDDLSEIKNKNVKTITYTRNNNKKNKSLHSTMRTNIKMNLPQILQSHKNISKSILYTKINENHIKNNHSIEQKHKTMIKKEKNYDYYNYKKAKEEEINNLYTTISTNSNFFREYPYNKIKTYFKKYKNIILNKIEPEKGSNIFPLLDNIENIGKNKGISKLAKSLDETKKYFLLRETKKNSENLAEGKSLNILDKVNNNENQFPIIKYDSAERIIFGEKEKNKE